MRKFGVKFPLEKRCEVLGKFVTDEIERRKENNYTRNDFLQLVMRTVVPEGQEDGMKLLVLSFACFIHF